MTTIRTKHDKNNKFTILTNKSLWDGKLSLGAIGLWARLLSRPNDWEISILELQRVCHCGKHTIYKLIDELIKCGYIIRSQTRMLDNKKNQFGKYEYLIFESSADREEYQKSLTLSEIQQAAIDLEEEKAKCPHVEYGTLPDFQEAENRHVTNTIASTHTVATKENIYTKEKKQAIEKVKRGEYVYLTDTEYHELVKLFSGSLVEQKIIEMDAWVSENRKTPFKNCFLQLKKWCSQQKLANKIPQNVQKKEIEVTDYTSQSIKYLNRIKEINPEIKDKISIANNTVTIATLSGIKTADINSKYFLSYFRANFCSWFGKNIKE